MRELSAVSGQVTYTDPFPLLESLVCVYHPMYVAKYILQVTADSPNHFHRVQRQLMMIILSMLVCSQWIPLALSSTAEYSTDPPTNASLALHCDDVVNVSASHYGRRSWSNIYYNTGWTIPFTYQVTNVSTSTLIHVVCEDIGGYGRFIATIHYNGQNYSTTNPLGESLWNLINSTDNVTSPLIYRNKTVAVPWGIDTAEISGDAMWIWNGNILNTMLFEFKFDELITASPTVHPTENPTMYPTNEPTVHPTNDPTSKPTIEPTTDPSIFPTNSHTPCPSNSTISINGSNELCNNASWNRIKGQWSYNHTNCCLENTDQRNGASVWFGLHKYGDN